MMWVFEEDPDVVREGIKWMAIAKVHTTNQFTTQALITNMNIAWSPMKEIKTTSVNENLFMIQCSCMGDWMKLLDKGPWLFRSFGIIKKLYDGLS